MRIAFIGGPLSRHASGVKEVVEHLSAALARAGHEVCVFGLDDSGWRAGDAAAWSGAKAQVFSTRGPAAFGYAPGIGAAIRAFRPDVVHAHGIWMYGSAVSAGLASQGVVNVISPHGMLDAWALRRSRLKKLLVSVLFERRHLRTAGCLHALNIDEATAIRAFGLKTPIAVIPNGVDLPLTVATPPAPGWRAALPAEAKVLLFLGRLHRKKNLGALIKAFTQARRAPWHLIIVGPDQDGERASLQAQAARLGAAAWVHFSGPVFGQEKAASFAAADAFVLPSLSEGLPMAVLEAWAARLPVAMSKACNLPEGFASGAALDTDTQPDKIAEALRVLFEMPHEKRASMGAVGRALVERDYSWDKVAASFAELYWWCCSPECGNQPGFVELKQELG